MRRPRRFLFDECIGMPIMVTIHQLVYSELTFDHICEKHFSGVKDEDWIPKLPDDKYHYVVISGDAGKNSIRGKKLPELCREHGVTHVILSPTLSQKPSSHKQAAITEHWSSIETLHDATPGSRFQLQYIQSKGKGGVVRVTVSLVPVDYAEIDRKTAERDALKKKRKAERGR